jgi:hypothetical protein
VTYREIVEADLDWIAEVTRASRLSRPERIQSLWGGYGEIFRVRLEGAELSSVIVKWIAPPNEKGRGHERKCRSYDVETTWYRKFAPRCTARVPKLIASRTQERRWLLVLEDLDAAGFDGRRRRANGSELEHCLAWLAELHARFLGVAPDGLWKRGTYWHLATRPDELAATTDPAIRAAAPLLDQQLSNARFRTIVHGDAKLANFCFARDGVAAVDFQYVGGGVGVQDVAYLLGDASSRQLDFYFDALRVALGDRYSGDLEREWRDLYPVAGADFDRFMAGWMR